LERGERQRREDCARLLVLANKLNTEWMLCNGVLFKGERKNGTPIIIKIKKGKERKERLKHGLNFNRTAKSEPEF
jgi:hypothetical protein